MLCSTVQEFVLVRDIVQRTMHQQVQKQHSQQEQSKKAADQKPLRRFTTITAQEAQAFVQMSNDARTESTMSQMYAITTQPSHKPQEVAAARPGENIQTAPSLEGAQDNAKKLTIRRKSSFM
jgi:hypothetical protein